MRQDVTVLIRAGVPTLLWGDPGTGKSSAIERMAEDNGLICKTVIASICDPTDFMGMPRVADGRTVYDPPSWAIELAQEGKGILFLDELSTAPPAVQAAALRVVLNRVVGQLQLPPHVGVVAAANPPHVSVGGWDIAPPLANRFAHIMWAPSHREWVENFPSLWSGHGAPTSSLTPNSVSDASYARARSLVAAFISARPSLLHKVPDGEARGRAWPSRRTWDYVSRAVAVAYDDGLDAVEYADAYAACVGDGAAVEFVSWVKEADLPHPDDILRDPSNAPVPKRHDVALAVAGAVASHVASSGQPPQHDLWLAAWEYVIRVAREAAMDVAIVPMRDLIRARDRSWPLPPHKEVWIRVADINESAKRGA